MNDRTGGTFMPGPDAFEITDEKFKELFKYYSEIIKETSIGQKGVPPSLSLHFRQLKDGMPGDVESALIVIDSDFNNPGTKRLVMRKVGAQCFIKKWILVAVCMASEAWASVGTKDSPPNYDVPPSKDPNRKEIIGIAGRTLMGECKAGCIMPVKRDAEGKFISDGEIIETNEVETYLIDEVFVGFRNAIAKSL